MMIVVVINSNSNHITTAAAATTTTTKTATTTTNNTGNNYTNTNTNNKAHKALIQTESDIMDTFKDCADYHIFPAHPRYHGPGTPNLPTKIISAKICWLKTSGEIPMDMGIPPLKHAQTKGW